MWFSIDELLRSNDGLEQFMKDLPFTYDVLIAGAGPVGLFLACELRLAGVSVLVLEQAEDPGSPLKELPFGMRGLSVPTLEALYRRGILSEVSLSNVSGIHSPRQALRHIVTTTHVDPEGISPASSFSTTRSTSASGSITSRVPLRLTLQPQWRPLNPSLPPVRPRLVSR